MALSDTCSDVSNQLASDIINYLDWGYEVEGISKLLDAIFLIASFQAAQDVPFFSDAEQTLASNRIVIGLFENHLRNADEETRSHFSEVVQVNQRLKDALLQVEPAFPVLIV